MEIHAVSHRTWGHFSGLTFTTYTCSTRMLTSAANVSKRIIYSTSKTKNSSSSNIDNWLVHIINIAALNFLGNDMFKDHALSWTTTTQWLKETCLQLEALQRLQGLDLSRFNEHIPHTATENLDVLHQGVLVQIVCQLLQIHPTSLRQIESQAATKLLVRLLHLRTLKTSEAYCVDSLALASKLLSF